MAPLSTPDPTVFIPIVNGLRINPGVLIFYIVCTYLTSFRYV